MCEGLATSSVEDCPELCPQKGLAAVTFCKKECRPTGKISRLLKIECLEAGMLNSSVDFQETPWLSRVLAELELSISVKAEAGGLHRIVCPALQAQTSAQDAHLDENLRVGPFIYPGRKEPACAVISISTGQDCAGHFRLHHPQLQDTA